jgi:hypothetical protein
LESGPNQLLQRTGHATGGFPRFGGFSRVSRLLSYGVRRKGRCVPNPEAIIRAELGPPEELLWAGTARPGILLRAADWFVIPIGLVWCGMVGFGLVTTIAQGGPETWFGAVVLSAFMVFGLYCLFGRLLVDAWGRSRTCYGVSTERVIIVSGLSRRVVRSLNLDTLTDVILSERPSGSGCIILGPRPPFWGWYVGQEWAGASWPGVPQLELAGEVRPVYQVILAARRSLK